jgi:hypothetical protein
MDTTGWKRLSVAEWRERQEKLRNERQQEPSTSELPPIGPRTPEGDDETETIVISSGSDSATNPAISQDVRELEVLTGLRPAPPQLPVVEPTEIMVTMPSLALAPPIVPGLHASLTKWLQCPFKTSLTQIHMIVATNVTTTT